MGKGEKKREMKLRIRKEVKEMKRWIWIKGLGESLDMDEWDRRDEYGLRLKKRRK